MTFISSAEVLTKSAFGLDTSPRRQILSYCSPLMYHRL